MATKLPSTARARILSCGLLLLFATSCRRGNPEAPQVLPSQEGAPHRVATAIAAARRAPLTLAVTGTLVADQQSAVTPLVPGRVLQVLVERGAVVREGDPLLRLRDVDYRSSAAAATAGLERARARPGLGGPGTERFDPENLTEVRAARAPTATPSRTACAGSSSWRARAWSATPSCNG